MGFLRRNEPGEEELAALADGSVAPDRRAELEARVAASPELADRLDEQQRAVALARSAAAEVEAPAALRGRIEAERRARQAPRPRNRVLIGAAATAVAAMAALAIGLGVFGPTTSGQQFQASLRTHPARTGRKRRRDPHQDVIGLAYPARCEKASPPRWRTLLRGLAAQPRRGARADRDLQRGSERHTVGGRLAEGLHDADCHARAGRWRSGVVGREGARRNCRHQRLTRAPGSRRAAFD